MKQISPKNNWKIRFTFRSIKWEVKLCSQDTFNEIDFLSNKKNDQYVETTQLHICYPESYPEIGDATFKYALWALKQQLGLKMWARCRISIVLP